MFKPAIARTTRFIQYTRIIFILSFHSYAIDIVPEETFGPRPKREACRQKDKRIQKDFLTIIE